MGRALVLVTLLASLQAFAVVPGGDRSTMTVECTKASAIITINILHHRTIGKVALDMRDEQGRCVYHEEGKARSKELVRKLDKQVFPKGTYTFTVSAKDLAITQRLVIE